VTSAQRQQEYITDVTLKLLVAPSMI